MPSKWRWRVCVARPAIPSRDIKSAASDPAYSNLAIEGEMAVCIGANGGIAAAFPVIELHHFIFRGPRKTLAELVANNGINAGAVIPNRHTTMQLEDWATSRTLSVVVNGATVDVGPLWAMRDG